MGGVRGIPARPFAVGGVSPASPVVGEVPKESPGGSVPSVSPTADGGGWSVDGFLEAVRSGSKAQSQAQVGMNRMRVLREVGVALAERPGLDAGADALSEAALTMVERAVDIAEVMAAQAGFGASAPPWVLARLQAHVAVPLVATLWRRRGEAWAGADPEDELLFARALAEASVGFPHAHAPDGPWESAPEDERAQAVLDSVAALTPVALALAEFRSRFLRDPFRPMGEVLAAERERLGAWVEGAFSRFDPEIVSEAGAMVRVALARSAGALAGALHRSAGLEALRTLGQAGPESRKGWVRAHPFGYDLEGLGARIERAFDALVTGVLLEGAADAPHARAREALEAAPRFAGSGGGGSGQPPGGGAGERVSPGAPGARLL